MYYINFYIFGISKDCENYILYNFNTETHVETDYEKNHENNVEVKIHSEVNKKYNNLDGYIIYNNKWRRGDEDNILKFYEKYKNLFFENEDDKYNCTKNDIKKILENFIENIDTKITLDINIYKVSNIIKI